MVLNVLIQAEALEACKGKQFLLVNFWTSAEDYASATKRDKFMIASPAAQEISFHWPCKDKKKHIGEDPPRPFKLNEPSNKFTFVNLVTN